MKNSKKGYSLVFPETREGKVFRLISDGTYWLLLDENVEPSHYSFDIWSYCDNPRDWE